MIRGVQDTLVPLKMDTVNPYCSYAYLKQNTQLLNPNALVNPNFLIWQRYSGLPGNNEINISYNDLVNNAGYTADKWYIKNYQFGSQDISITQGPGLFSKNQKLTSSLKISSGADFIQSFSMNVALSQDIEGDKLFNLLGGSAALTFYVKSSIRGYFSCALTIFDRENEKKYVKVRDFYISQPDTAQKVSIYFYGIPNVTLERRNVGATLDISISGKGTITDSEWHSYGILDTVVTCSANQANLFNGTDNYFQVSNTGIQPCIVGHSSFPELNAIDYQKDLTECQEFFERVIISRLRVYPTANQESYSSWEAPFKMNSFKRNSDLTFTVANKGSKLYYQFAKYTEVQSCDLDSVFGIYLYKDIGTLYTQKDCFLYANSSLVDLASNALQYAYITDLIIDVDLLIGE